MRTKIGFIFLYTIGLALVTIVVFLCYETFTNHHGAQCRMEPSNNKAGYEIIYYPRDKGRIGNGFRVPCPRKGD
jgi:hypothetical protein